MIETPKLAMGFRYTTPMPVNSQLSLYTSKINRSNKRK